MDSLIDLHISECEPGMKIAQNIHNNYGAVLLYKDSILDLFMIEKLKLLYDSNLKVYKDYAPIETDEDHIGEMYENNISELKQIIKDIGNGKELDTIKVQDIIGDLGSNFNSVNDILSTLNSTRSIDDYTYSHSINVSLLSGLIAKWLNLGEKECRLIAYCGLLHDIGKSKISPEILSKPSPLTLEEFKEIKKHPILGYEILANNIAINKNVATGVLMHHEREDGSGYPLSLKSNKIHPYAKIVAIADVFDAMTSDKVYKCKQTPFDVFRIYESEYLTKFDTNILLTFLNRIASFYIGNNVKLNTQETGEIIFINHKYISKPMVKLDNSRIVDLSKDPSLSIVEIL